MILSGSSFGGGFLVGFGVGFVTREIVTISVGVAKPLTKSVVKTGLAAVEKSRETLAHIGESFEDLLAEVKSGLRSANVAETSAPRQTAGDDVASDTSSSGKKKRKGRS